MTQPLTFVILSTGLESFKEIRGALASESRARLLAGGNDAEQLYDEIVRLKPNAAIITLGANTQQALMLMERLATECPQTALISAARDASPDLILRAMRSGAREFLRLPIIKEELETVLDRIGEVCSEYTPEPKKKGRMISVFSSKGGCGTSFVASNLACTLKEPTVLVDLNLQAGDLPLFLGIDPKYSIADVVENRARLDNTLVASYITPYSSNVSLLAAPREADSADEIEPEHVFEVLERLRENYSYVVIDPQHTFDAITLAALDQSDDIVLVLTLDIPAIRSAQRALKIFDRLGYSRSKVRVIVNRWSKQIDLDLHQVEKFLGEPVVGFVPSDYHVAVSSINLGQPLVQSNPNSRIAVEIQRIAAAVTGEIVEAAETRPERKNFWSALFRRERAGASTAPALHVRESLNPSVTR